MLWFCEVAVLILFAVLVWGDRIGILDTAEERRILREAQAQQNEPVAEEIVDTKPDPQHDEHQLYQKGKEVLAKLKQEVAALKDMTRGAFGKHERALDLQKQAIEARQQFPDLAPAFDRLIQKEIMPVLRTG